MIALLQYCSVSSSLKSTFHSSLFKPQFLIHGVQRFNLSAGVSGSNAPQPASEHSFYRNCDKATTEPVSGQITGQIPKWLEGTLIRNGSGIFKVGNDTYNHLFDGLSVLHRYHISDGHATYTSRALESDTVVPCSYDPSVYDTLSLTIPIPGIRYLRCCLNYIIKARDYCTYKTNMKANRIVVSEFGTAGFPDPCQSLFQKFQSKFSILKGSPPADGTDNCSVTVGYYGDQLYAMTETNFIRRIDPNDLKTIGGKTKITDYVAINHASAHPHVLEDGSILNIGSNYRHKSGPHYCLIKVPPTFGSKETSYTGAKLVGEIPFHSKRFPSYYHSFGMTKNHAIFIETPLRMDLVKIMKSYLTRKPFAAAMTWNPDVKTKFHLVSLKDGSRNSVVYVADGFFTFHHINAFEEDGNIVVDVAGYDTGAILSSLEMTKVGSVSDVGSKATARRFVLPLNVPKNGVPGENLVTLKSDSGKSYISPKKTGNTKDKSDVIRVHCESHDLTKIWQELPRINYNFNGEKYNFFYALSSSDAAIWSTPEPNLITKTDIKTREIKRWSEEGKIPSEPIFVANPSSKKTDEDDGVVLSALMHKNEEAAVDLLILNAKDMKEIARAKFKTAGTFTGTFHGQWAQQGDKIHRF